MPNKSRSFNDAARGYDEENVDTFGNRNYDDDIFNELNNVEQPTLPAGSVVVQPIPIAQIRVDLEQPRKIMPRVLREKWDGTQPTLPPLLNQWIQMAGIDVKQAKSLAIGRTNVDDLIEDIPANYHLRRIFSLAASIFSEGQRTAVELRELAEGGYMIVSGERRWTAINFLVHFLNDDKYATVLAKVEDMDEWTATKAQSIENNQREELTASGKARQFGRLLKTSRETFADDDYKDMSECASEYDFYLQFADGRENNIPHSMTAEFESAMGMSARTMRYYRALFAPFGEYELDRQLWNLMDDNMWSERFVRDIYTHLTITQVKDMLKVGTMVPTLEQALRDAINDAKRKKKQSTPANTVGTTPALSAPTNTADTGTDDAQAQATRAAAKRAEQLAALKYVNKYLTDPAGTRVWCYDLTADNELQVSYANGNKVNFRVTQVTLSNDQSSSLKARPTADGGITNPRISRRDVKEGYIVTDKRGQAYKVLRFLAGGSTMQVKSIPQGINKSIAFTDIITVHNPDDAESATTDTPDTVGTTNGASTATSADDTPEDNTPADGWLGQTVETPNGTRGKIIGWKGSNLNVQTENGTQEYTPTSLTVVEPEEDPEPEPHITDTLYFESAPDTEDAMLFGLLHTFISSYSGLEEEMKVLSEVGLLTMEEGRILHDNNTLEGVIGGYKGVLERTCDMLKLRIGKRLTDFVNEVKGAAEEASEADA